MSLSFHIWCGQNTAGQAIVTFKHYSGDYWFIIMNIFQLLWACFRHKVTITELWLSQNLPPAATGSSLYVYATFAHVIVLLSSCVLKYEHWSVVYLILHKPILPYFAMYNTMLSQFLPNPVNQQVTWHPLQH
jgi:hypothetical protein